MNPASLNQLAEKENADIVIYGNYTYSGNKNDPDALIQINAWAKILSTNVMVKSYKSKTGVDIFDTIDGMITDSAEALLKTGLI